MTRKLGQTGPDVSLMGLGLMGMSDFYGNADEGESLATIEMALERGVTLLDTGDFYGVGHNETLLGRALKSSSKRDQAVVSVKFGALRDPSGGFIGYDCRPNSVKNFLAYSLKRLGLSHIDIYRPSRVDPQVPFEDTLGAIAEMKQAGYVRHIGLSEVGADTLRKAAQAFPISDLQIEYSLLSRGIEEKILPVAREFGIGITAYGVLGRGLIAGQWTTPPAGQFDFRAVSPRFQGDNLNRNRQLANALAAVAQKKGVTAGQLAIAWVLSRGDDIVPLVGARRRDRLTEALEATGITLTPEDLAAIERAVPKGAASGERYPAAQMAFLDSEKASS